MIENIRFQLNGRPVSRSVETERMLLSVLRYDLGLTGTKYGCGEGYCGACTVLVDKEALRSCQTPVKAGESGLPFIVNQQTKGFYASVALLLLPGLKLQQTLENIEACRICPGADNGNLS